MLLKEFVGALMATVMMFIANSGGSAVGGVITPIVTTFFGYDVKMGIAISQWTSMFSGWLRFAINFKKKHPKKGYGLLIDYNFIVIMFPTLYIGATIGIIAYTLIPSLVIAILLTIVLFLALIYTTTKTILIYRAETREFDKIKRDSLSNVSEDGAENNDEREQA